MREIKFRGMDIVNNKWLYGNLEIPLINQSKSKHFIIDYSYGQYQKHEVDPKTIGQYTGLKDCNGKEIYEMDILHERHFVSWSREKGERYVDVFAVVVWHDGGFTLKPIGKEHVRTLDWTRYEIIGNIYENPELLEGREIE